MSVREGAAGGNVSTPEPASEPVPEPVAAVEAAKPRRPLDELLEEGPLPGLILPPKVYSLGGDTVTIDLLREEWEAFKAWKRELTEVIPREGLGRVCACCAGAGHFSKGGEERWNEFRAWEDSGAPKSKPAPEPRPHALKGPRGPLGTEPLNLSRSEVRPMFKESERQKMEKAGAHA